MSDDTVPFGKYRGRPVEDMLADADYMDWLQSQPWFRARYGRLLTQRDAEAASRTPVHNRLQALFLNEDYTRALLGLLGKADWERFSVRFEVIQQGRQFVPWQCFSCDVLIHQMVKSRLASVGWEAVETGSVKVEIKPTVADDYPAVLRQMGRNNSGVLFVGRYEGEGATEAQFVAMFAASGRKVLFKRDVDAEAAKQREGGR